MFGTADDVSRRHGHLGRVKAQARDLLGIHLTDADVDNVPLLATDAYGNFIRGPNGFAAGRDQTLAPTASRQRR